MSMYGKYPKVLVDGKWCEQNGMNGAPKAWPTTDCSKDIRLTSQAPREDVDINKIIQRIEMGKTIDSSIIRDGVYQDISEIGDLSECIIKVQNAWDEFMTLPAEMRERFNNSPTKLVEFLSDPKNKEEAIKLGLVNKPVVDAEPGSVPPVSADKKPV